MTLRVHKQEGTKLSWVLLKTLKMDGFVLGPSWSVSHIMSTPKRKQLSEVQSLRY